MADNRVLIIDQIVKRFKDAYAEWESGATTSPSARDLVHYALEIAKVRIPQPEQDDIADALWNAMVDGAAMSEADAAEFVYRRIVEWLVATYGPGAGSRVG